MFTGLIQDVGEIARIERSGQAARIWIKTGLDTSDFGYGESISISGVCLTLTEVKGNEFRVDVSSETLSKSSLDRATPGARVNIERALQTGDRFGGHFVLGHVDGVGRVREIRTEGEYVRMSLAAEGELIRYMVPKGSVAVDGVSLTVNEVWPDGFSVMLIPTTLKETTLTFRKGGDMVNIEADIIGKYIENFIAARTGGITLEKLKEEGWK